ncbi:MAG: tetratricopeptide repeat protein, partial [Alphaproteobacteria bacterium]
MNEHTILVHVQDLLRDGRVDEARDCLLRALARAPLDGALCNAMALVVKRRTGPAAAVPWLRRALLVNPDDAMALNNLANILLFEENDPATAAALLQRVTELAPTYATGHNNLAFALYGLGRLEDSVAACDRALAIEPDHVEAHINRAHANLALGRYAEGWTDYEWRWRRPGAETRAWPVPAWEGEDPAGRTILLHAEQGYGDAIQFIRFAPLVAARGARVVVEVPASLVGVLRTAPGCERVVASGVDEPFDLHCPLLSLPRVLGIGTGEGRVAVPYLRPEPALVRDWAEKLACAEPVRIGIIWAGNAEFPSDRQRSPRLEPLAPLLTSPRMRFFGLQMGDGRRDLDGR